MSSPTATAADRQTGSTVDMVDPRAPRFGQSITALGLAAGIALREPLFVYAVTAILVVSAVSHWRLDLYGFVWRTLLIPVVGEPAETEPASPHRFAKLLGAAFTAIATGLLLAGSYGTVEVLVLAGYVVAGLVAALATLAAVFDLCVGCRMYQQVSFFRRIGWV